MNILEVTGLIFLDKPLASLTWSEEMLAVCMLRHKRRGALSTLGIAFVLTLSQYKCIVALKSGMAHVSVPMHIHINICTFLHLGFFYNKPGGKGG